MELIELGGAGVVGAVVIKVLDFAAQQIKQAYDQANKPKEPESGPPPDDEAARIARQAYDQSKANASTIDQIARDIGRLVKMLDGNGRPGVVENLTKLATIVDAHINDEGRHTSPR